MICSTDDTYPDLVPGITKSIKDADKKISVILAGYPKDQIDAHKESGVDDEREGNKTNRYRFAFVMPKTYTLESLPVPDSTEITLKGIPARLMAVRRYSGTWSEDRYRKNEQILLDAIKREGLKVVGEPIFARYNAPFSLWFLRRNEVLIEILGQSYE